MVMIIVTVAVMIEKDHEERNVMLKLMTVVVVMVK